MPLNAFLIRSVIYPAVGGFVGGFSAAWLARSPWQHAAFVGMAGAFGGALAGLRRWRRRAP
jgi:hypothetical protein